MSDDQTQQLIKEVEETLARADKAVTDSDALLARIDREYAEAVRANDAGQAAEDAKIKNIVQRMDAATVRFVKDTSV